MNATCYLCGESHPVFEDHEKSEGRNCIAMYEAAEENEPCRAIVICTRCMEKGDFDMWTNRAEWDSKNPAIPHALLPLYDHDDPDRNNPLKYPAPKTLLAVPRTSPEAP